MTTHIRLGWALGCALAMATIPSLPAPGLGAGLNATMAQRALDGTWSGEGTTLVVDTKRLQVNMDPDRPFEWRALRVVNVAGHMVVFDVGPMRYVALLSDPSTMTLTSPSFIGQRSLHRAGPEPRPQLVGCSDHPSPTKHGPPCQSSRNGP